MVIASNAGIHDAASGGMIGSGSSNAADMPLGDDEKVVVVCLISSEYSSPNVSLTSCNACHFSSAVVISTGATAAADSGTIRLVGGTSEGGQGGDVEILGGQSTEFGTGGRVLLGGSILFAFSALQIIHWLINFFLLVQ